MVPKNGVPRKMPGEMTGAGFGGSEGYRVSKKALNTQGTSP